MKGMAMKRFVLSVAALTVALTTNADTYGYLSFQTADGSSLSVGVEGLSMTFTDAGSKLVVTNSTESRTLDVADLNKMFFSDESATAISEVGADSKGYLQVYTVSGSLVGTFSPRRLDEELEPGIYLVKQNGKTTKIAVK